MDIKIDLNLNAPELVEAIKSLADEIAAKRQCSETKDAPDESPDSKANIAMETVRAKLAALAQSGKQEQVKTLIQKYGASRLSDLDPAHYAAVLQEAEEIR